MNATLRTTTSLSGLLDAVDHFTRGIAGAQEAGEQLRHELGILRSLLSQRNEERAGLQARVRELEIALEEARSESELEQKYVRDEQDEFIAALMEEYESEIHELKRAAANQLKGHAASGRRPELEDALDQIEALLAEREVTRDLVQRAQRQRDEAQRERDRLEQALQHAQAELQALALKSQVTPDTHTRPTEPPPNENPYVPRVERLQRQASHAELSLGLRLKPDDLDLADLEPAWDLQAIPAPPPSFDETHRLAPDDPTPRRITAPPAELQPALTSPPHRKIERQSSDGEHIPASEELPMALKALMLPIEHVEPPRSRKAAGPQPQQPSRSAAPNTEARPTQPSASSSGARPTSVYPDPYRLDDKPPLKRKPDHSLRPLVDYSKSGGEIAPEQLNSRIPRARS